MLNILFDLISLLLLTMVGAWLNAPAVIIDEVIAAAYNTATKLITLEVMMLK